MSSQHPLTSLRKQTSSGSDMRISSPSSEAQTPGSKLHIDARAAELKERLLRNRSQKSSRDGSLTPAVEKMQSAAGRDKKPLTGSTLQTSTIPPFVPHPMPKQPPETSVPADANDIAALISSISSASHDEKNEGLQAAKSAVSGGNAMHQPQGSRPPTKEITKVTSGSSARPPARGSTSDQATSPPEEGEITNSPKQNSGKIDAPERLPRKNSFALPQASAATTKRYTTSVPANKQPQTTRPLEGQTLASPSASASASASRSHNTEAKQETNRREPRELVPSSTYYRTPVAGDARNSDNDRTIRPPEQRHQENKHGTNESAGPGLDLGLQLASLLKRDHDLRDWLTLTQYFETESRTRKLTRYRKLAEMDAEQKRMQAEQQRMDAERQKLLAEEESERGMVWQTSTPTPLFPALAASGQNDSSAAAPSRADNALVSPMPPSLTKASVEPRPSLPLKRDSDIPGNEVAPRPAKIPRLEDRGPGAEDNDSKQKERNSDSGRDNPRLSGHGPDPPDAPAFKRHDSRPPPSSRGPSPRRYPARNSPPGGYGDDYRRRSPSPRRPPGPPVYRSRSDYFEYNNYRGDSGRGGRQQSLSPIGRRGYSPPRGPKHINLGHRGG